MQTIMTNRGDGMRIELSREELRNDIVAGSEDAARKGMIDSLTAEDIDQMMDIFCEPGKTVSVEPGKEVVATDDGAGLIAIWEDPAPGMRFPSAITRTSSCMSGCIVGTRVDWGFPIIVINR